MMRPFGAVILVFALAACGNGPIFDVDDALYDWVKQQVTRDTASDTLPIVEGETVLFQIRPGQSRSAFIAGEDWRIGQTYLFGFDFRMDAPPPASADLVLSRLLRTGAAEDVEIISVSLDAENGLTVMNRPCIAPDMLGEWHRVEARIRLSNADTGFLEVFCDREPIWAMQNIRTTWAPGCRWRDGCDAAVPKSARFFWEAGLMAKRPVGQTVSAQMARLHYRVLFWLPNRAGEM